ncbi:hypothetical protein L3Q82_009050 [Scortum barcoo]|uniref:Uncharacterized protein n=1 Tax=Scortum barcoo TaxID=214431 RepID=A0ACB8XDH1_9TELE|nr:hypothetical protein L3Q82_009050 [Scortum barcoo]
MSLGWPGNAYGIPPEELEEVSGVREVWASLLRLLPPRPWSRTKRMKMDGWMDGWMFKMRISNAFRFLTHTAAVQRLAQMGQGSGSEPITRPPATSGESHIMELLCAKRS